MLKFWRNNGWSSFDFFCVLLCGFSYMVYVSYIFSRSICIIVDSIILSLSLYNIYGCNPIGSWRIFNMTVLPFFCDFFRFLSCNLILLGDITLFEELLQVDKKIYTKLSKLFQRWKDTAWSLATPEYRVRGKKNLEKKSL